MTTISELSHTLNNWIRHLRMQRALTWLVRGLTLGLVIALVGGVIALYRLDLLREEFVALVLMSAVGTSVIASIIAYLWPVEQLRAARYFDRAFRLGERVSTALELDRDHESSQLAHRQMEDALRASRGVKPMQHLPLQVQGRELPGILLITILVALVWFRGDAWFKAAAQARAVEDAVAAETAQIEELIEQIESNQALSEEQQQQLVEPLQQALGELQNDPSLEGSVSVLTSTAQKLEGMSSEQTEQMSQALLQTGNELSQQDGPMQSVGENLAQGNNAAAANELANMDLSQMSDAEKGQLAGQLSSMAQSLATTNLQLAQQLNNAAQALQNGDQAAAQQALNQAAQSLAQAGQQVTMSQTAGQASQQMQQGAQQVITAGGGQAQTPGGNGQQGQGIAQTGQTNGPGGSGAGNGEGTEGTSGNEAGNTPIDQNNGPGDGGEAEYEQIYAPTLLGGEDGSTVNLPSSGQEGEVIGQGPTDPSQPGQSLVPYNEVYAQYDEFNREAMESGQIPLSFMDIIRNYFDSLEP
jgi:hypothetical protein